ncbi:glycosyltransferase family 4 protein [Devosia sp. WQ 349K1]|uniref:glycosyltransferase family 4 protein n=1 Tax=Devosia sp. WQ 349K1 TaxID=2800329 RepID=UPI0020B4294A|nr:glycosyltransferase family 4 protein [Devosia sp. WQ 349K1]
MRIALIADAFPPMRTSSAVQLRDLAREFIRQGHQLTLLLPSSSLDQPWHLEHLDGVEVLRLRAPRTKDIGYVRRTLAEIAMPIAMRRNLAKSPLARRRWDGVVWYSPSIFHGPLVSSIKRTSDCRAYLIVRDIFPEWAVDMGLMRRGPAYHFFNAVAQYQYRLADVIGMQTPGNGRYFAQWHKKPGRDLEVLQNWLDMPTNNRCSVQVADTVLAGRKLFVYAGNMGVAQGLDIVLDLAEKLVARDDVGFLFVGRGSEAVRLKADAKARGLTNTLFFDEIDPDEIPDLYSQCAAGIVALDSRHKSHNIPGKFLTYMQSGLPVLANVNAGNDIAELIRHEQVGEVCETNRLDELAGLADVLLVKIDRDREISSRCRKLFSTRFSVVSAARQIAAALAN